MDLPKNHFKAALRDGRRQIGVWNTIGGNTAAEALASCGFDWVLVDAEHGAMDTLDVLPALQAIAGYPQVSAVVRPPSGDPVIVKRLLDFGAQTLMIPYVQTAAEAAALVSAMRYGPDGVRGSAGMTRAARFGAVPDYAQQAAEELCLIVQIETVTALDGLEEIGSVRGVDALFIGPADLAASMGLRGQPGHDRVVAACEDAIRRCHRLKIPVGILTLDPDLSRHFIQVGTTFDAVGVDLDFVVKGARQLREAFR